MDNSDKRLWTMPIIGEVIMAVIEIARGGNVKIPAEIRRKYRIRKGIEVNVSDENGVITIRPQAKEAVELAKKVLRG